jgi:hypothetical protein
VDQRARLGARLLEMIDQPGRQLDEYRADVLGVKARRDLPDLGEWFS